MGPKDVTIGYGTRIGFWNPHGGHWTRAFKEAGIYTGPDLGDQLPGKKFEQKLMEGDLKFRVGVLFRPDRGKHQSTETILIFEKYIPEMWDYDSWLKSENQQQAL